MYDRDDFDEHRHRHHRVGERGIAAAAARAVRALLAACQHDLAECLNAFNEIYLSHPDPDESGLTLAQAIGGVARRATATAIFALAITERRTWRRSRTDTSAGPGGRPSPGPASHNSFPYPLKQRRASACPTLPAACPHA